MAEVKRDTVGDADRRARLGGNPDRGFNLWLTPNEVVVLTCVLKETGALKELVRKLEAAQNEV